MPPINSLTFSLSRLAKVNTGQIVTDAFSGPSVERIRTVAESCQSLIASGLIDRSVTIAGE